MLRRVLAVFLLMPGFAVAQDDPPTNSETEEEASVDVDAPTPLLRGLSIVDAEVQNEALDIEDDVDAPVTTAPPAGTDLAAIFNRAQLAYATEDFETAYVHARNAASGGHAQAATLAGLIHENEQIAEASDEAAMRWYRRAADQNEPVALYRLGRMAQAARGGLLPNEARSYFQRSAQAGNVDAMLAYAMIMKASPVPQDAPFALEWAERAAGQGNVEAMFQLAQMFDVWERGPQDPAEAREWYQRAADNNHAEAALQAGLMASAGEGGDEDPVLALALIRQSAEAGFAPAMGQYGLMLHSGWNGAEPDSTSAAEWFAQGAIGGDAEARYLYALALATGDGVERDLVRSYYWTLMAEFEMDGSPSSNTDRRRLEAQLENHLTSTEAEQVRSQIAAYRAR
jgi:TPR repeat protein